MIATFALQLDEKRHTYDAKHKTFHITMEDLLGWEHVMKRDTNSIPEYPIDVTNPNTGITVRFEFSAYRGDGSRLYGASYAHDLRSSTERYLLILWKDMAQYLQDIQACEQIELQYANT